MARTSGVVRSPWPFLLCSRGAKEPSPYPVDEYEPDTGANATRKDMIVRNALIIGGTWFERSRVCDLGGLRRQARPAAFGESSQPRSKALESPAMGSCCLPGSRSAEGHTLKRC